MKNTGCLYCSENKRSYHWSGADIYVAKEIFSGSYLKIVEILEDLFKQERYPKEEVFQCEKCNAVWHVDYYFPDRPQLHVNAEVIPKDKLKDFFLKLGAILAEQYNIGD